MAIATLEELRQRLAWPGAASAAAVPVGVPELARLLPQGHRERSLVEWLGEPGSGAATLALRSAAAAAAGRPLALVAAAEQCHASALAALGLPLARVLLAEPRSAKEFAWTVEEALRCPALGAVVAWPGRFQERVGRRWQRAVESGCRLGVLVRSAAAEREPCWAAVRWRVEAAPGPGRHAQVSLVRGWGAGRGVGGSVRVQVDGEAMAGGVVSELADPTPPRWAAGA